MRSNIKRAISALTICSYVIGAIIVIYLIKEYPSFGQFSTALFKSQDMQAIGLSIAICATFVIPSLLGLLVPPKKPSDISIEEMVTFAANAEARLEELSASDGNVDKLLEMMRSLKERAVAMADPTTGYMAKVAKLHAERKSLKRAVEKAFEKDDEDIVKAVAEEDEQIKALSKSILAAEEALRSVPLLLTTLTTLSLKLTSLSDDSATGLYTTTGKLGEQLKEIIGEHGVIVRLSARFSEIAKTLSEIVKPKEIIRTVEVDANGEPVE